jgi:hypothetical protein
MLFRMADDIHDMLLLLGRPASGKSEIIDYLNHRDPAERRARFRIGTPVILDDFPMLWAWFEEDAILEGMGKSRLHTTTDGYFLEKHLWNVLIRRLCLEYDKLRAAASTGTKEARTFIIEFSRGSEHGGYREAFENLSGPVWEAAGVFYVNVSFEESLRKNRRRFNPDRPHSILEHGLADEKMDRLYRHDDWSELPRNAAGFLLLGGCRVPAVSFENEDDVTTPRGDALGSRLEESLRRLWEMRRQPRAG